MKKGFLLLAVLMVCFTATAKEKVAIGARDKVELTYPEFAQFDVQLDNKSGKPLIVAVIDPTTGKQVQGFGLGPMGKVVMTIEKGHVLTLKNSTAQDVSISIDFLERRLKKAPVSTSPSVTFTLQNSTMKSIPLVIPDVMNPNLSPLSTSGVRLRMGQEIYYKKGMNKKLLLVVDESITQGDNIDVAKLIKSLEKN